MRALSLPAGSSSAQADSVCEPVLEAEIRHAREVAHVPTDEREIVRERNRGDPQIGLAERRPGQLEPCPQLPVQLSRRLVEGKDADERTDQVADALGKGAARPLRRPAQKLTEGDRGR